MTGLAGMFRSLALPLLIAAALVSLAAAGQVNLPGEWYDQEKDYHPVSDRDWYYEFDPADPLPPVTDPAFGS